MQEITVHTVRFPAFSKIVTRRNKMITFLYVGVRNAFSMEMMDMFLELMTIILSAITTAVGIITGSEIFELIMFLAICILLTHFYADLISLAKKDMLSIDRYLSSFAKLIIAVALLLFISEIVTAIANFGNSFFSAVQGLMGESKLSMTGATQIEVFGEDITDTGVWPEPSASITASIMGSLAIDSLSKILMGTIFGGVEGAVGGAVAETSTVLLDVIIGLLMTFLNLLCQISLFFLMISTAFNFLQQIVYTPLAAAGTFEENRSTAANYLKELLATSLTFAGMLLTLWIANMLMNGILYSFLNNSTFLQDGKIVINGSNILKLYNFKICAVSFGCKFGCIGAVKSSQQFIKKALGAAM